MWNDCPSLRSHSPLPSFHAGPPVFQDNTWQAGANWAHTASHISWLACTSSCNVQANMYVLPVRLFTTQLSACASSCFPHLLGGLYLTLQCTSDHVCPAYQAVHHTAQRLHLIALVLVRAAFSAGCSAPPQLGLAGTLATEPDLAAWARIRARQEQLRVHGEEHV